MPLFAELTGQSQDHVEYVAQFDKIMHREIVRPLGQLQEAAARQGFDLQVVSAFRDFETQKQIWNKKARGQRDLLDDRGEILTYFDLTPAQIVQAILRWSALPGASRHHWGTDMDVIDANALPHSHYIPQLVPSEVNGIFRPFYQWLGEEIRGKRSFGFFRPYALDLGGVAPEAWHLSYAPLAQDYRQAYSYEFFEKLLGQLEIDLREEVCAQGKIIYQQYITNISAIPWI